MTRGSFSSAEGGTGSGGLRRWVTRFHSAAGRRRVVASCLALLILTLSSGIQAQQEGTPEDVVGFVLDKSGEWLLRLQGKSSQPIRRGDKLPAGATLRPKAPGAKASAITIALMNARTITCLSDKLGPCEDPLVLQPNSSPAIRIVEAVANLFSRQPERYVSPLSRAPLSPGEDLQEAVVKLSDEQIALSPLLRNMPSGLHTLQLELISRDVESAGDTPLDPMMVSWDPNRPLPIPSDGLRPGLYQVRTPTGHEAWVLVSGPGAYEKASALFQKAVDLTKQWGDTVKPQAVRSFLRAYLESLAEPGQSFLSGR